MTVLSWLVLVGALGPLRADDPIPLHIGGTFPMEAGSGGWAGGQACLPAVQMALEDVNSRPDVLPGYVLHMNTSNSKCQAGLATQQLYDLLYTPPTKLMLLAGCSPVTTVIAESAPVWKLVVLTRLQLTSMQAHWHAFYQRPITIASDPLTSLLIAVFTDDLSLAVRLLNL
ncbi:hypothetical protein ANCCEY_01509 [Ancylostoma ceylanicum]|uniref:Receptor ligand binding region domain-containing protein n=1 Tax=Ancylostoma ceylanicum TaxID=53326 RepID=A0A0D6M5H3_9BILA|nr:hypothetical protein ANCCEY_01509 [Ancylostoma ceylanicum]